MSKSYSKNIKLGTCSGNNSEFYAQRRKSFKKKDKQAIRNTLAHFDVEDFDENYNPHTEVFKDDWMEPTDGTITVKGSDKILEDRNGIYLTKDKKIKK